MFNLNLSDVSINNNVPDVSVIAGGSYSNPIVFNALKTSKSNIALSSVSWNELPGTNSLNISNLEAILGGLTLSSTSIRSINFTDLKNITGSITINNCTSLNTFSLPELVEVGIFGSIPSTLTSLVLPKLKNAGGFQSTWGTLTIVDLPSLENVVGGITLNSVTTLNVPNLKSAGTIYLNGLSGIQTLNNFTGGTISFTNSCGSAIANTQTQLNLPAFQKGTVNLQQTNNTTLTTVTLPSLLNATVFMNNLNALTDFSFANNVNPITLSGATSLSITNCAALTSFSFPTLVASLGNISFSGCALNQTSIDAILVRLSQLDGTAGTTLFGTGRTVNLTGGTNATPSATGLAAKGVLVARGVTVTNN